MSRKYRNIGPETLELVETAPLPVLRDVLEFREDEAARALDYSWPEADGEEAWRGELLDHLNAGGADALRPIEDRCRRIRQFMIGKGPTSLGHVARERCNHEDFEQFEAQPDTLCRSAWFFLRDPQGFEDAEAFHAARQYRDFRKMYDSFEVNVETRRRLDADDIDHDALASLLTESLELPPRATIGSLNLPATENHPASVLVIVRHGGPLSSVLNYRDNGIRNPIYYRPPNEAILIWTPSERLLEICGQAPAVRKAVGDAFAEVVLQADMSTKPLSWRYYDLSRFRKSLSLDLPAWDDIEIPAAKVIEIELRLGNWKRRLGLRVTIDDDIEDVAQRYLGGDRIFQYAEGFSKLAIAVHYSVAGAGKERSLELSFGDRRSNLQGMTDPEKRDLGYRLLQFWGILDRLQVLDHDEVKEFFHLLLRLHDLPDDAVVGSRIRQVGLDPKRLMRAGILELRGKQNVVLIDDNDDFGDVAVGTTTGEGQAEVTGQFGEDLGSMPLDDVRQYIIKREWLEEVLLTKLKPLIGRSQLEQLDQDLIYLGRWTSSEGALPLYFARRLDLPETLQRLDVILRSRQDGGVGIVLSAVASGVTHLGPNVVMPLASVLQDGEINDDAKAAMLDRFKVGRWLALGGSEVTLARFGEQSAMLYIPGLAPLVVSGSKQMLVIERLVAAYKSAVPEIRTGDVVDGTGVRSPPDAWPSKSRKTVAGVYFENSRPSYWRLKTDHLQ